MNRETRWMALLGRRDEPVDGVGDYCSYLAQALARRGIRLEVVRVPWAERGWRESLRWLEQGSGAWRGQWVLLQYTALGWSRRGFPARVLAVLKCLQRGGARCAVHFHDSTGFAGERPIDRIRRACQHWVMRALHRRAEWSLFTVAPKRIPWLSADGSRAALIPAGANFPAPSIPSETAARALHNPRTIAVYGVSECVGALQEIPDIAYIIGRVAREVPQLRLLVFGRGSAETKGALQSAINGTGVELSILGYLPAEDVGRALSTADVLLFVRGPVSTRRGSAIAAIACGLPVAGYEAWDTARPITEAGLLLAPLWERDKLAEGLIRVLREENLWRELCERSRRAWQKYFSWDAIAQDLVSTLASRDAQGRSK